MNCCVKVYSSVWMFFILSHSPQTHFRHKNCKHCCKMTILTNMNGRCELIPHLPVKVSGWEHPGISSSLSNIQLRGVFTSWLLFPTLCSLPCSLLCYSSDRQLSLDLVNVGRQRLDFLPMLEHSGTYRETAMHTGTFAQEIITLVHQVKEQYFRDDGVTLNERFSTPPNGGRSEEVMEELTLDERFNSNRGFSLKMKSQLDDDDDEPLFRPGHMQGPSQQPVRAPGDLRHDLERRRQERLEGVKVTIPGSSMSLHPLSEMDTEYRDKDEMEEGGFSNLPEDQSKRREANMGPRRGASYRQNTGPQRRNNRSGNRPGQMRRQNNRSNPAGPSWWLDNRRTIHLFMTDWKSKQIVRNTLFSRWVGLSLISGTVLTSLTVRVCWGLCKWKCYFQRCRL